jgi:hypothetical protein
LVPVNSVRLLTEAIRIGTRNNIRSKYSEDGKARARDFGIRSSVDQYWSVIGPYAR